MRKCVLLAALAALLGMVLSAPALAATYKKMVIRAATANPPGSLHVTGIEKFKEVVEKESGGQISVQTFYGGSMGDEQANVKQLRNGELHVAVLACGNLTPAAPSAGVFILPYMFPDLDDAKILFHNKEYMDKMADLIAKQSKARPLAWLIAGYRHLTSAKHPITKMADLQGLKIRVPPVELQLEAFRSWGVEPHPLAWSETFNGLQQGVVDGAENAHTVNRDQKFWEVQKHITISHYMLFVAPMLVSEPWYSKLDKDTKELIDKAMFEAQEHEWKWADEQDSVALQDCLSHGMQVHKLEDEAAWAAAARSIWPKFYDKIGGKAIVDEALAAMKK